jgi:hypothetical protein
MHLGEAFDSDRRRSRAGGQDGLRLGDSPIRHTLTIEIRNTGALSVHMRVSDIRSPIGNFVAQPETFTIEPGATQLLEPMHSSYPDDFESVGVLIRIRTAGGEEERVITLTGARGR